MEALLVRQRYVKVKNNDFSLFSFLFFPVVTQEESSGAEASKSMVMIVAVLVGILGTVALGLVLAVVVLGRRRRYAAVNKGAQLIVAEEM